MISAQAEQCAHTVLMVKPSGFAFNEETATNNHFQQRSNDTVDAVRVKVQEEFRAVVRTLANAGVDVIVIDPFDKTAPDAVFPNNWFTTHADGTVVFYPMCAEDRRKERSNELTAVLRKNGFAVRRVIDLSPLEQIDIYLEGTGSLILDRKEGVAFAAVSSRTSTQSFQPFQRRTGMRVLPFNVADSKGNEVYHTNVMMSLGAHIAVVCSEVFTEVEEYNEIKAELESNMKQVVGISESQMRAFCGNILEVHDHDGKSLFVMSHTAYRAFTPKQREVFNQHGRILPVDIPTIEQIGGGGVRCMMAEIFLPKAARNS